MRRNLTYILFAAFCGLLMSACSEDSLSSESVIIDSGNQQNTFDLWLDENYRQPYNISFKYKYEHIESDMTYDLVPAELSHSMVMARMIKHLWLDAYAEVVDVSFLRTYSPRIIMIIGSGAWEDNGTLKLGTAEGGLKVTLYVGNWLDYWFRLAYNNPAEPADGYRVFIDMANLNTYYFHTMHHEFAHVLHQTKDFPAEFKTISAGSYAPGTWYNRSDEAAAALGFISRYAGSEAQEDFVEIFAFYITLSEAEWDAKVAAAGETGGAIIKGKLAIVKKYMAENWAIDMDKMRAVLARRCNELYELDWMNL